MSEAKHAPTPYLLDGALVYALHVRDGVEQNRFCCYVNDAHTPTPELIATARFIVRACNAHDDLLAALKLYIKCRDEGRLGDENDAIEAVIAKAEGLA